MNAGRPESLRTESARFPLHPFLFAAYAVLALLARNLEEIVPGVALRSLLVSLLLATALVAAGGLLLKDRLRAALLATLLLGLFFTYGHVYSTIEAVRVAGLSVGRHRFLAPLWLLLLLAGAAWILQRNRPHSTYLAANQALNIFASLILLFPLAAIGLYTFNTLVAREQVGAEVVAPAGLMLPGAERPPDIYYIIVDAYSRDDVLKSFYGLDNRPFLQELQNLGFTVAPCSQSNYSQTLLSLTSALNMNYLQSLDERFAPGNTSRVGLEELLKHNAVRKALESLGYTSVAFETGFKVTQWEDAGLYLSAHGGVLGQAQWNGRLNDFELLLLRTTSALVAIDSADLLPSMLRPDLDAPQRVHRERILFALEELQRLPETPGPKFVFAHLVIPHPPYVFGPQGEFIDYEKPDKDGYRDQVSYLNSRLIPLLREIINASSSPPIIILQGDHGGVKTPPARRNAILNAYYLPGAGAALIYERISPANSFRLVFDLYFGGKYPLLADRSYYSTYQQPFDLTGIADRRAGCSPATEQ